MERRKFIQKSALGAAGILAATPLLSSVMTEKIQSFGFQVYTVRDVIQKDMEGTLKTLKKAGYDYAEFFDFGGGKILGKPIAEAKKIIEKSKIDVKSIHVMTGAQAPKMTGSLINEWQKGVDDAAELGAEYLACAYLLDFERKTLDQYKQLAELFNKAGEACKKSGIQFAYHNHDFEFQAIDGVIPYDLLLSETDEDLVKMELDIYWVRYAELDPIKIFQKNPKRYPLWHVKDMELDNNHVMTEVGNGIIDYKQLFAHEADAGLKYFFVEQDRNWKVDPITSLKTSIKHLKGINY
ncbi:MAG: xylose isomerase [Cytophagales bacterium CG12_big_fil_rev_8_21_14_0_65_40_12]|nr:MAG: xylose isomerase [Cytophagales bacterium CG12_big_fil_rev_8_21_14_0_65_40_12]PIW03208.1 MAG: xylose isomerase [Cytophagales bacterium CG17_big_fil_post_rev_8_21_14_2_50_40_13]